MKRARLFLIGLVLILGGGGLGYLVQTAGGVEVRDIRIPLGDGRELSALLHMPPGATEATPAPAVLAVHGYINSRETQGGFAIEFARRGMVVLALDQAGHGFSDGPAFVDGYGGPAALAWLRAQTFVDPDRIGMEGHSMGGWTSLAAAAAHPDGYRSIALVGSSTGTAGPTRGTATFPRNLAVIFSRYDEFGRLMWGVTDAADVASSAKLQEAFGTESEVEPRRVYGSVEDGTARWLTIPNTTHPGDHLSREAIGDAVEWMTLTLGSDSSLSTDDQIWYWKEFGTGLAFVGGIILLLGVFELLLGLTWFAPIAAPGVGAVTETTTRWWGALAVTAALPALTYFPLVRWGGALSPSALWRQGVTNQILVWAVGNGVIALALLLLARWRRVGRAEPGSTPERAASATGRNSPADALRTVVAALATVGVLYVAVAASGALFKTDLRFWVVALKPMAPHHLSIFLSYLVPFTAFFYVSHRALHTTLSLRTAGATAHYATGLVASAGGMFILVVALYSALFATGHLPVSDALFSIVAIQFVPVLAATGVIAVFTWRRTDSPLAGAIVCGLWVTWYIVAGQATHL